MCIIYKKFNVTNLNLVQRITANPEDPNSVNANCNDIIKG